MKGRYRLLSYKLNAYTPIYGGNKPLVIMSERSIIKGDSCNLSYVCFNNHFGTHVDTPNHFSKNGRSIIDYDLSELIFDSPLLVECEKSADELIIPNDIVRYKERLANADILLLKTGFFKKRGHKDYRFHNPGVSPDTFRYLRTEYPNVRAVMIDSISITGFQKRDVGKLAHKEALTDVKSAGQPLLLIEDADLSGDLYGLSKVIVAPLFLEGVDSMPCTVIGIFS